MTRSAHGCAPSDGPPRLVRVSAPLVRTRRAQVALEPPPPELMVKRPSKVAQMLALGHEIVRLVDAGLLRDLADAAEMLGFSRGRVSQIVDLTLLAPDLQEALLFGEEGTGQAERRLRVVVTAREWAEQRARWGTRTA